MRARVWVGGAMSTLRDAGGLVMLCCVTAGCTDDSAQTALPDGASIEDIAGYDAFDAAEGDGSATPIWEGGLPAEASGPETDSARTDRAGQPTWEMQRHASEGTLDAGTTTGADTSALGQQTPVEPSPPPTDSAPRTPLPTRPNADVPPATPPSAVAPDAVSQAPSGPSDQPPLAPDLPQTPGATSDVPSPPADPPAGELTPDAATSGDDAGSFADAGAAPPDDLPSLDAAADDMLSDAGPGGDDQDAGTQLVPLLDAGSPAIEAPDAGAGSAACETCVASSCTYVEYGDLVEDCRTLTDVALAGTRAGEARSQLCMELLSCARRTRCAVDDVVNCLCGTTSQDVCFVTPQLGAGPCAAEAVAGTETTDDYEIFDRLLDNAHPSGAALNLAACESTTCASACQ